MTAKCSHHLLMDEKALQQCYSSLYESRTGRWGCISRVFAGLGIELKLQEAPRLWGGDPDTQVRAQRWWENGFVTAFTWKSNVGSSGDLAGEIYGAVMPTKGLCRMRAGLQRALWGFPLSPGWMMWLVFCVSSETGLLLCLRQPGCLSCTTFVFPFFLLTLYQDLSILIPQLHSPWARKTSSLFALVPLPHQEFFLLPVTSLISSG